MPSPGCRTDVSRLILHVETDAEWIGKKAKHLVASRLSPSDLIRNCEILQDYGSRLLVYVAQIIRRCEDKQ